MAKLTNPWIGYIDRSFQQIKKSLIDRLVIKTPEIKDHSESNILIIIISMFAGTMEMLGLYIDNMAREAFVSTARRFSSMVKLVKILDYRIKANVAATVNIKFTLDNPVPLTNKFIIPINTEVQTESGIKFFTTKELTIEEEKTSGEVGAEQTELKINIPFIVLTNGQSNQAFILPSSYTHDSLQITIDDEIYEEQKTFGLSKPADNHFIIEIREDKSIILVFGDNINGRIPPAGFNPIATFKETQGSAGNVDSDTIINMPEKTTIINNNNIISITDITINNNFSASGGLDIENIENIRRSAPISIRTLDRAVTRADYKDLTSIAPGVGKAFVSFNCGKTVDIFILPLVTGPAKLAQKPLLDSTKKFMDDKRMITTKINIFPAGITRIKLNIEASARFRRDPIQTELDIKEAIKLFFDFENQDINKAIRTSDVIAIIDNLEKIDFLNLSGLSTIPYAHPTGHSTQLNWKRETLLNSNVISSWRLEYQGGTIFRLFRDNVFRGNFDISGPTFLEFDNVLKFDIDDDTNSYNIGDRWDFKTYPFNKDIILDDFTIPSIEDVDMNIIVNEQFILN